MSTIKHLKGHAWLISKRAIVFSSNTWVMRYNEPEDLTIQTIYCSDILLLMTILLIMDSIMSKGENILLFHPTPSIFNTVIPDLQVNNKIKEEGFRFQTFVPRYVLPLIHIMMLSISITIISPLSPDTLTKPRSILSLDWKRQLLSQRTTGSFLFLLKNKQYKLPSMLELNVILWPVADEIAKWKQGLSGTSRKTFTYSKSLITAVLKNGDANRSDCFLNQCDYG